MPANKQESGHAKSTEHSRGQVGTCGILAASRRPKLAHIATRPLVFFCVSSVFLLWPVFPLWRVFLLWPAYPLAVTAATAAIAAVGIASARSVSGPRVTSTHPAVVAASSSSADHPPSGPSRIVTAGGATASAALNVTVAADAAGSTNISRLSGGA